MRRRIREARFAIVAESVNLHGDLETVHNSHCFLLRDLENGLNNSCRGRGEGLHSMFFTKMLQEVQMFFQISRTCDEIGVVRGAKTDASPKTGNEASLIQRVQICFGEVSGGCRSVRIGPLSIQKRYHLFYDTPSTSIQIGL